MSRFFFSWADIGAVCGLVAGLMDSAGASAQAKIRAAGRIFMLFHILVQGCAVRSSCFPRALPHESGGGCLGGLSTPKSSGIGKAVEEISSLRSYLAARACQGGSWWRLLGSWLETEVEETG